MSKWGKIAELGKAGLIIMIITEEYWAKGMLIVFSILFTFVFIPTIIMARRRKGWQFIIILCTGLAVFAFFIIALLFLVLCGLSVRWHEGGLAPFIGLFGFVVGICFLGWLSHVLVAGKLKNRNLKYLWVTIWVYMFVYFMDVAVGIVLFPFIKPSVGIPRAVGKQLALEGYGHPSLLNSFQKVEVKTEYRKVFERFFEDRQGRYWLIWWESRDVPTKGGKSKMLSKLFISNSKNLEKWGALILVHQKEGAFHEPTIMQDNQGKLLIFWASGCKLWVCSSQNGEVWGKPQAVFDFGVLAHQISFCITQHPDGRYLLVYAKLPMEGRKVSKRLFLVYSDDLKDWSEPKLLCELKDLYRPFIISTTAQRYLLNVGSYILRSRDGIVWSKPAKIFDKVIPPLYQDRTGKLWAVVYSGKYGYPYIWLSHSRDGENWSEPIFTGCKHSAFFGPPGLLHKLDGSFWLIFKPYYSPIVGPWRPTPVTMLKLNFVVLGKDSDGDGLTDLEEQCLMTNSKSIDTDKDGENDKEDLNPLAKSRWLLSDKQRIRQTLFRNFIKNPGILWLDWVPEDDMLIWVAKEEEKQEFGSFKGIVLALNFEEERLFLQKYGMGPTRLWSEYMGLSPLRNFAYVRFKRHTGPVSAATCHGFLVKLGIWWVAARFIKGEVA